MKFNIKINFFTQKQACLFLLTCFLAFFLKTSFADAWWNEDWQFRRKIVINAGISGVDLKENINEFPVLVRLHSGNVDFLNLKEEGEDIRFVSGDDTAALKFHIEKFDSVDELAICWVKAPSLHLGRADTNFIWMYYGNSEAVKGDDPAGTYDGSYLAVYHFNQTEGFPADATGYANNPSDFSGGLGLPGIIGDGLSLSGAGDRIVIPQSGSLNFAGGFTFSGWIKISVPQENAFIFHGPGDLAAGIKGARFFVNTNKNSAEPAVLESSTDIPFDAWHFLTVTAAPGKELKAYLNGTEILSTNISEEIFQSPGNIIIGSSGEGSGFFLGELDEIVLLNRPETPSAITAALENQGPNNLLTSIGGEEFNESGGIALILIGTILKNLTIDGMVIIGILLVILFICLIVFFSKAYTCYVTARDNAAFLEFFQTGSGHNSDYNISDSLSDRFFNSSIFRIYSHGCGVLKKSLETSETSDPELETEKFKTSLEKALMKENQNLNAWMVLLTMAITGGPFLGLLGTVWGVMNTFAAMAEAGEANIMAIAPGVASALSTTVFGLITAIPALFGYNYLVTKIRSITVDMNIFVDEFGLRRVKHEKKV